MDMRILSVLLIIGVAGSFGAVDYQPRIRRSVPVVAGRSPDELASRLLRIERDVAPKGDNTNGSESTTPAPSTSTRQKPTTRTSSTPKSTEETPAPTSTSSFPSSTTPRRAVATTTTTTKKPEAADSKSSTPDSSSKDASALSPRSNFNDDDDMPSADHGASQGVPPQVTTSTFNSNLPPMNSVPYFNGWGSSGANAFASSSAGGYAGAGSFYPPASNSFLQGRSGVYEPQVAMDYGSPYPAGNGYYNLNPFPLNNFADPTAFQRMMDQQFQQLQAQIEAQHRANMRSTHAFPFPRILEASNSIGGGFPSGFPDSGFGSGPNTAPGGPQSAQSAISLGPRGGFQAGAINPVGPGIESRFAEEVPAPSGNSFGVFSSSSSSSRVGPDGKQVSHKTSTTGVNDNGKITFRTVQD